MAALFGGAPIRCEREQPNGAERGKPARADVCRRTRHARFRGSAARLFRRQPRAPALGGLGRADRPSLGLASEGRGGRVFALELKDKALSFHDRDKEPLAAASQILSAFDPAKRTSPP